VNKDLYYEGLLLKQEGKLAQALEKFESSVGALGAAPGSGKPEDATAWNEIGLIHDDAGRLSAAEKCYERAVGLDPTLARAWNNWGVCAFVREDWDTAKTRFERALEVQPNNENSRLNLADVLEAMRLQNS
jgi:protein O-GlcNAc transferase